MPIHRFRTLATVLALVLLAGLARAEPAAAPLRVLMLGNSYTAMTRSALDALLKADRKLDPELVTHCPGGRKLTQHATSPKVAELLTDSGPWDLIVLQEQSQLPAFAMAKSPDPAALRELDAGAPVLIPMIRQHQPRARILLFETWARYRGPGKFATLDHFGGEPKQMQEALTRGYQRMVRNPGSWDHRESTTIAPVGRAFGAWYARHGYDDPDTKLQRKDNSHPNAAGAFLTAAVLYQAITGRPAESPARAIPAGAKQCPAALVKPLLEHARSFPPERQPASPPAAHGLAPR